MDKVSDNQRYEIHKRNGTVDLFRLLYALIIMTGHSVTVGMTSPFPFEPVGILVEFFVFLTGYYTCLTFSKWNSESTNYFENAMRYTWKKFKVFIPYLVVSVGLSYSIIFISEIQNGSYRAVGSAAFHMLSEMFLMNYVFSEIGQRVAPLFYLAALLVVFPVFCMLTQIKNKSFKLVVAMYAIVFYYHDTNVAVTAVYPRVLLRVLCGLCGGMVLYYCVERLKEKGWKCKGTIGIILLAMPLILSGLQMLNSRVALICEFVGLAILLADNSFDKNNHITDFAAKMSMIVYILHWSIGQNINFYLINVSIQVKLALYYIVTIVMTVTIYAMFGNAIKR